MITLPALYNQEYTAVDRVDLLRLAGVWYKVASSSASPNSLIQSDRQEFAFNSSGELMMHSIFTLKIPGKRRFKISRKIEPQPQSNNTCLKILSWWGTDSIHVVGLAEDYSYLILKDPKRNNISLLYRKSQLDSKKFEEILQNMSGLGHDFYRLKLR